MNQTAKLQLSQYKSSLDIAINQLCVDLITQAENNFTPYSRECTKAFTSLLKRGGKRMRGALVINSYKMLGGTDDDMILRAAVVVEIIHAYLLIIDDIADNSTTRRGGPAAHEMMKDYHKNLNLHGDAEHFGTSIAMHTGLTGCHLAFEQIGQLQVDDATKLKATNALHQSLLTTIHGQYNDIFNEAVQDVDEAQVLRVLTWKTAYYSFLSPLQFGAILAKADTKRLDALNDYSMNLGLAFQITDDILGTFGNEFESGKSAKDDLCEGKITILVAKALANSSAEQKNQLIAVLGKHDLTDKEHENAKKIIQQTGALGYSRQLADKHAKSAMQALKNAPQDWQKPQVEFLQDLADYVVNRNV